MIIDCLESISTAILNAEGVQAEIVVVDNASQDDTFAVVSEWAKTSRVAVKLLREPCPGLANARNCGVSGSCGTLLAFTDDDCRMDASYVLDALRHDAGDTEPTLRGGRVELGDATDLPITIKTSPVAMQWQKRFKSARLGNVADSIAGANMVMRRSLVERLGPFDWRFSTDEVPAGEDVDYIFRAYIQNILIEYVPNMTVVHFHGRKIAEQASRLLRSYMIGSGALYMKHGLRDYNLCRQVYWDVKGSVKELTSGSNLFWPAIGFSTLHKVKFYCIGGVRFLLLFLSPRHPRRPRAYANGLPASRRDGRL